MWYYTLWLPSLSLNVGVVFLNTILSGCYFRIAGSKSVRFFTRGRWHSVRQLLFTLLATALIVPYFKRRRG